MVGAQVEALPLTPVVELMRLALTGAAAGVEELAKAQNTLLAQTDKRSAISAEWKSKKPGPSSEGRVCLAGRTSPKVGGP